MKNRPTLNLVAAVLACCGISQAQPLTLLYSFNQNNANHPGGWSPNSGVVFDQNGDLYGTTPIGGNMNDCLDYGCGVVYELSSEGTYTVLYSFEGAPNDGSEPYDGVVRDTKGNLYGTTYRGGSSACSCGTVFKLTPEGVETVLHNFQSSPDGAYPTGGLILVKDKLYGVATGGGGGGWGSVFEIAINGSDFTVLYNFCTLQDCADGATPWGTLAYREGNLYGTTENGGANGVGTVFQLAADGTETVLHSFAGGTDGAQPIGGPVFGAGGNLYGTTYAGGANSYGVLWKVTLQGVETVLHTFDGHIDPDSGDGDSIESGLIADKEGNLYGFAQYGGGGNFGTVYELSPGKKGWTFTLLHVFAGGQDDGAAPLYGALTMDAGGNLYGTTQSGGQANYGTIYKLTP